MKSVVASTMYLKENEFHILSDIIYSILQNCISTQILVEKSIIKTLMEQNCSNAKNFIHGFRFHGEQNLDNNCKYNFVGVNGKLFLISIGENYMKVSSFKRNEINYSYYNYDGKFNNAVFICKEET